MACFPADLQLMLDSASLKLATFVFRTSARKCCFHRRHPRHLPRRGSVWYAFRLRASARQSRGDMNYRLDFAELSGILRSCSTAPPRNGAWEAELAGGPDVASDARRAPELFPVATGQPASLSAPVTWQSR